MKQLNYQTSSFCAESTCVEVAVDEQGNVRLHGGTRGADGSRRYTTAEWRAFVQGVLAGELHCGLIGPVVKSQTEASGLK